MSSPRPRVVLISHVEKALVELVSKTEAIQSQADLWEWLHSMRIEMHSVKELRIGELQKLRQGFRNKQMNYAIDLVRELKNA